MTANTNQPYQKLALVPRGDTLATSFLLAASGPTLISIHLRRGTVVSAWSSACAVDPLPSLQIAKSKGSM
jgi:hypothetical protein